MSAAPIGVFDSGMGGLTVTRALQRQLPKESIIYLGDTARVPYGNKSKQTVIQFSTENTLFLLKHRVKLVVVACNTASSYALAFLRRNFQVPVLGVIGPGARSAVQHTKTGRVGVIGTHSTVGSESYPKTIRKHDPKVKVFQAACPLFVPLAEEGWTSHKIAVDIAKEHLAPLKKAKVDTLILGCTHYPLLKKVVAEVMGPKVTLIDSAEEVAREVEQKLDAEKLSNMRKKASYQFYATDAPASFEKLSKRFLGKTVGKVKRAEV